MINHQIIYKKYRKIKNRKMGIKKILRRLKLFENNTN